MLSFSLASTSDEASLPLTHAPGGGRQRRRPLLAGLASGRYGTLVLFLGTAALSGVLFHILAFSTLNRFGVFDAPVPEPVSHHNPVTPPLHIPPRPDPDTLDPGSAHIPFEEISENPSSHHTPSSRPSSQSPARPSASGSPLRTDDRPAISIPRPDYHELSLEQLQSLVSSTKGYFARDFSLGLGWNNMRYIIEAAVLQASLLNRTLVLPSFVYARACEYDMHVCAEYAPMVNKGDAIGWDEWRTLPIEQQMGWRLPMSLMLNLTHIREKHPVILISDYLRLHGRPAKDEHSNGAWSRDDYHSTANVMDPDGKKPTLFVVENHWYDPSGVNRVDYIPEVVKTRGRFVEEGTDTSTGQRGHWPEEQETAVSRRLSAALPEGKSFMDFAQAKRVLQDGDTGVVWDLSTDEQIIDLMRRNGWEVLYTFLGALGGDYTKTVVNPLDQVVKRSSLRGWVDEYARETADVLVLAGETHLYRKPGAMRFSTMTARADFQDTVLNYLVPVNAVNVLAEKLVERMNERVGHRLWMGAHMRRGDFVRLGWAMEADPETHVKRVKERLSKGREVLESIKNGKPRPYNIPGVLPNRDLLTLPPPQPDDAFYVATDERDPAALKTIASHGAVFMKDLLEMDDLRDFGWPLMITDYRAIVEQHVLAYSSYFYAHGMSSVAGGVVNMRAAAGADQRTALLD